jgi:hypothetical protein
VPSPLTAAGSQFDSPPRYVPLHVNRWWTGLWTNRSALRDAATPYLYEKFYSASRFESMIAGLNVELSPRLTPIRRPGNSVYNSATFSAINDFYSFRVFNPLTFAESIQVVADTSTNVYNATGPSTKTSILTKSTGSTQTSFQSLGNTLYMADGVDNMKYVYGFPWSANTAFAVGDYIIDSNGNLELCTTAGTTGATAPSWSATLRGITTEAGSTIVWVMEGPPLQNWQIAAPTTAPVLVNPVLTLGAGLRFWASGITVVLNYTIADSNGNIQYAFSGSFLGPTGSTIPNFNPNLNGLTTDGGLLWLNAGPVGSPWAANTTYTVGGSNPWIVLDSNFNYQLVTAGGVSGATTPAWNATLGGSTTDNTVTWKNIGKGQQATFGTYLYCYSWVNDVTGDVSTASPTALLPIAIGGSLQEGISGARSTDPQVGHIWVFRSTQGESTPFFELAIGNPNSGGWSYTDTLPDSALNQLIAAPLDSLNNPPPLSMVNLTYYLSRMFSSFGPYVYYSSAPLGSIGVAVDNWPPNNYFLLPSTVYKSWASTSGIVFFTNQGLYISSGTDINGNPNQPVPFLDAIGIHSVNCFALNGSTPLIFTGDNQFLSLDPSSGASRVGFPIEDQLQSFSPINSYVTFHTKGPDQAAYIANGSGSWFRVNLTPAPEQGSYTWSPQATIIGGCKCVKSIETSPGVRNLLLGPQTSGPILMRDTTTNQDNGTSYAATFTVGSIVMAQPGQAAAVECVATCCLAIGSNVAPAILADEVSGTFETLTNPTNDPTWAEPSTSVFANRWYFDQLNPTPKWMQHMQVQFTWPTENHPNEILTFSPIAAILNDAGN